jgi:hypothetical protein
MKKVTPEVIEYFCDACDEPLSIEQNDDYKVSFMEIIRDGNGYDMNTEVTNFQLCSTCFYKSKRDL